MCLGLSTLHHIAMCSHCSLRTSWQKMTTFIRSVWSLIFVHLGWHFWISIFYGKHYPFFLLWASLLFFLIDLLIFPMNFKKILSTSVSPPNISSPCCVIFHIRQPSSWICLFQLANDFHRDGIGRNEILCH